MVHYVTSLNPNKADVEEMISQINNYYNKGCNVGISESIKVIGNTYQSSTKHNDLIMLNNTWQIKEPMIVRNPGIKGTVKWYIKKVILKIIHGYIADMISEQESFNAYAVKCINNIEEEIKQKKAKEE